METGPTAVPPLLVSPALPSCWPLAYLLGGRVTHAREAISWTSMAALWPIGGKQTCKDSEQLLSHQNPVDHCGSSVGSSQVHPAGLGI